MKKSTETRPSEHIEQFIYVLRGQRIMLDRDLANLYQVTTGNLNKAVSRNIERFPEDFMFSLNPTEFDQLIFHFGRSSWGGTRKPPRAFTEQGIAMLSTVLRSKRAIRVNIQVMRTFVKLREFLTTHRELRRKLEDLEKRYDSQFKVVFDAIRQLMAAPKTKSRRIGFDGD